MKTWSDDIFYLLLVYYCLLGSHLVEKYIFNYSFSPVRAGLIMTAVFLSAYPIFGWKRNSPWARLGSWSFKKWFIFALGIGAFASVIDVLSYYVVHHFSD